MKIGKFYKYKGYVGTIEYDLNNDIYYGKIKTKYYNYSYSGNTFEELYRNFKKIINDYINYKKIKER